MNSPRQFWSELSHKPQGMTIVVAALLPIIAIVCMFPLVPQMIEHFAADPQAKAKVPLMVTAPGLSIAIFAPFAGFFADRFGRRPLLLWCTLLYAAFGVAPFFLSSLNAIFVSRLLLGICEAGILTINITLIGDYWDDKGRRSWLLLQGLLGPFVSTFAVLAAGAVAATHWNFGFLIYLVALPIYLATLLFIFEPRKPEGAELREHPEEAVGDRFPFGSAAIVAAVTLFMATIYYVFIVNGGLVFKAVGVTDPARLGRLYAIPSLFILVGAFVFKLMSKRSSAFQIGMVLAALGLGLTGMGLASTVSGVLVFMAIQQTGAGMSGPTFIAWAQTKFPFAHRGRGMGLWTSSFFLGQFVSPWFVHQLDLASGSMQRAFAISGAASLAAGLAAFTFAAFSRTASAGTTATKPAIRSTAGEQ